MTTRPALDYLAVIERLRSVDTVYEQSCATARAQHDAAVAQGDRCVRAVRERVTERSSSIDALSTRVAALAGAVDLPLGMRQPDVSGDATAGDAPSMTALERRVRETEEALAWIRRAEARAREPERTRAAMPAPVTPPPPPLVEESSLHNEGRSLDPTIVIALVVAVAAVLLLALVVS